MTWHVALAECSVTEEKIWPSNSRLLSTLLHVGCCVFSFRRCLWLSSCILCDWSVCRVRGVSLLCLEDAIQRGSYLALLQYVCLVFGVLCCIGFTVSTCRFALNPVVHLVTC